MILPDGYSDVPAGKIAAVVTHLEMTERPARESAPSGPWTLRHVDRPDLAWYRGLLKRVGEEWLWASRIRMADDKLASIIEAPQVEIHALVHEDREEGLLEFDFREAGNCEIVFFGVTAKLVGTGAAHWLMQHALQLSWSRPITRLWLHTCTLDHPAALPFYQRAGFRPFRRQVEVEDDPRLDGTAPRGVAKHVPVID
ncbi:GNAT family N-acetyltransferase [Bradyrhizobium lablabi]|uniref:GNAT family N-acetyltransferase n=1 Tax=Bradyrhizobium lablabi TaxID=722472 RepID=UPI001BAA0ADF|nr:GNAT family N-acetyltransferase [Bradyrhizobium lablabi]MBR1122957.1 GNAT family N-acetyltransferase [Bradyrhizobium lablabi]